MTVGSVGQSIVVLADGKRPVGLGVRGIDYVMNSVVVEDRVTRKEERDEERCRVGLRVQGYWDGVDGVDLFGDPRVRVS